MWDTIKSFLNKDHISEADLQKDQALKMAISALLVNVASTDEHFGPYEKEQLVDILTGHFSMKKSEASALIEQGMKENQEAVDLHKFVRVINADLDHEKRKDILYYAWQIVLADGIVNEFEDHLIRKLGPLLGISRQESIAMRERITGERSRG